MANVNITEADSSVVYDYRMRMLGDNDETNWLQSPVGSNEAVSGGLHLLVVDIKITGASAATTFDLTDAGITGLGKPSGASVLTILGLNNQSGAFEIPADIRVSGSTVLFTSPSGTNTDIMRLSILYFG